MSVILTRVTIEATNNIISYAYQGLENGMPWEDFVTLMPPPFDTENLFYVGYEPDRNIFVTERRGGVMGGEESEEITWIRDNLVSVIATIEQNSETE